MYQTDSAQSLHPDWRSVLDQALLPGETVIATAEIDLDAELHYTSELIVLTDQRFLSVQKTAAQLATRPDSNHGSPNHWALGEIERLRAREHAGLGTLEAHGVQARLGCWRYSGAQGAGVHHLISRFEALRSGRWAETEAAEAEADSVCPGCGAPMAASRRECAACQPKPSGLPMRSLMRLGRFARPHLGLTIFGFVLLVLSTAAGLVPPYLTMPLMDNVLVPHQLGKPFDFNVIGYYLAGLGIAAVIACLLSWAKTYVLAWVSERIAADMRNATYEHLQSLSLEFFGGKRTGDLMSRISNDTDRICLFLSVNLLEFGSDVLMILLTSAILFSIDPTLALVTLLPFPLIAWLVHTVRDRLLFGFQLGGRAMAKVNSVLADTIPGIRVVKAFAQERREIERFRRANDAVLVANDRVNRVWSFFGPVVTLLTEGGLLVIWASGAWRVSQDQITVGVLTAFLTYISRFYTRIESMSRMLAATQRAAASSQRIFEILDRVPSVPEPLHPILPSDVHGQIELRNVNFQYGTRAIVENVSLTIRPGEMIGLVGPSGAGKSTLVNLVCRFYDVTNGAILVDGVDIRSFPVQEFRRHIGVVLQEPFLFYGTVAENIAYGRPDATPAEIIAAAKAAKAHEFILRLPDGYDSIVGERGQSLSGGERQRISIARALLIDPKILILDEATSSVDTETELEIQEALDNLIEGRTTIAIAHRLSTLRKADRLVVMERGRIVEVGPQQELLKTPGAYSRLHQAQRELAQSAL